MHEIDSKRHLQLTPEERKALRKDAVKLFTKEFERTEKGNNNRVHSYHYTKYALSYIYHMKSLLNRIMPQKEPLVHPEGEKYAETDDVVKMYAAQTSFNSIMPETNDYHAKVLTIEDAGKILTLKEDLNLPELPKTVVPYEIANKTILKNPDRIAVITCPCREVKGDAGCYPRDVCLVLGEPWVSFALAFGGDLNARAITSEEALAIVKQQHEMGNVQAIFWKKSQNERTYAICNCCMCCCTALQAYNYANSPMFAGSGYKVVFDDEMCVNCGACVKRCKFGALSAGENAPEFKPEKCMGCGVCTDVCAQGCLSMTRDDPSVCEPLDVDVLIPLYTPKP
ncbi:MAG: 4Fe-4S binding protein [Clostridiales Family XIII bacterium]|jgi:ferredoxin|nr:4Fe-4S binding protein [Clostridiales Family XIII bacterium]